MGLNQVKLWAGFIKRQVMFTPDEALDQCAKIQLVQIVGDMGNPSPLHSHAVQSPDFYEDDEQIANIAAEFLDMAQADAESSTGAGNYCLIALLGIDRRPGERSPRVRLSPNEQILKLGAIDSGNVKDDIIKQCLHHNEAVMRIVVADRDASQRHAAQLIQMLSDQVIAGHEKRIEYVTKTEELEDRKHERELDSHREMAQDDRKERVWKMAEQYVPIAVAKLRGKELPEGADDPQATALKEAIGNIPQDKMEQMMELLGEHAAPFAAIYMMNLEKLAKEEEAKQKEKAKQGGGNGQGSN